MKSKWPNYTKKEINKIAKIIKSGKVNYWTGNEGVKFEKEFSKFFKVKYTSAIANASLGLECALKALNIKKGDEVIVPSKSYVSSASCVVNVNAKPIFSDVDLNSQNISAEKIKKLISSKTKAIICVHLGGYPCEMKSISKLCKKFKLKIIEDCSQAHGAKIGNEYVGSFGDISVWSFCNDKIISTLGEGGMIGTNNKNLYEKIWQLKEIGKQRDLMLRKYKKNIYRWVHNSFGTNLRLTEVQSAVGRAQLRKLNFFINRRKFNSKKISYALQNFQSVNIPHIQKKISHAFYRFYIQINPDKLKNGWSRNKIIDDLIRKGIGCNEGSCSELYREKSFRNLGYFPKKRLKNARKLSETSIAFQIDHTINYKDLQKIILSIKDTFQKATKRAGLKVNELIKK